MEQRISKWQNGHPCLWQLCSAQHFRKGCGRSTSDQTGFGKPTIQNSKFNNSYSHVYEECNHLCPRRSGSQNSVFTLWICLVPSRLHIALRLENWDTKVFVSLNTGTVLLDGWGQNRSFETVLLFPQQLKDEGNEWSTKPYSYPSTDQYISPSEQDVSESDMSPSISEMHNESSMFVVATAEHGLDLAYSIRKTKTV
jgi:hypothetical protein